MSTSIHPSAFVAPGARLGKSVTVGPCVVIEDDVIIGEGTQVHAFASVKQYTTLGRNNVIHSYAMVGGIPQDLKFSGEVSRLEIGDNNTIREFATLHRGTAGDSALTRLGSNNLIMAYCHVAHDCMLDNHIIMSNGATLAGHVKISAHAIIGGLSAIHQFVRIGRHAFVGGMTGITHDLPPYMMAVGSRAGIHGPNLVGLRRLGLPSATVTAVRAAFRILWLSGMPRKDALNKVEQQFGAIAEVQEIIDFVRQSPRGVLPAIRSADVRN